MTRKKFRNYRIALTMLDHEINKISHLKLNIKRVNKLFKAKQKLRAKIEKSIKFKGEK